MGVELLDFNAAVVELGDTGRAFGIVTLVDAHGSTPADAGARMVVDDSGLRFGTVGGGRVEAKAIGVVQDMLAGREATRFADWSLRADVGMTCGGRVRLFFETRNAATWTVAVFGAGHVTQALARVLAGMPCRVICIDPRADWLALQAIEFPGINFFWMGTILMMVGLLVNMILRIRGRISK